MTSQVPVFQNELDEVSCSQCGAALRIRGMGRSSVIGCEYCGAVNGLSGKNIELIKAGQRLVRSLLIPLGVRGKFENTYYEIIGCVTRTDKEGRYPWNEYLLFNPYQGYRWLVEQNGHWLFVLTDPKLSGLIDPDFTSKTIVDEGKRYKRFDSYDSRVFKVVGECYWEVKAGDTAMMIDYISPPYLLSFEKSGDEIVGSRGLYMSPEEISLAFNNNKDIKLPYANGVAPAQPNPNKFSSNLIGFVAIWLFLVLTFFQIFFLNRADSKMVYSETYNNTVLDNPYISSNTKEKVSGTFRIDKGPSNLRVDIEAPVDNSWVSVFVSLLNSQGEVVDEKEIEVSYYHGYDSDGSWHEGGTKNYNYFEKVPSGVYLISTSATTNLDKPMPYILRIYNRVPYWGNYIFVLCMLLFYPIYLKFRSFSFETRRNENSTELSGGED